MPKDIFFLYRIFGNRLAAALFAAAFFVPLLGALLLYQGHARWENALVHTALEVSGSAISVLVASLILFQWKYESRHPHFLWISLALGCMGIMDFFHALTPPSSAFYWSRTLATLFGGILFLGCWLPDRVATQAGFRILPPLVALVSGALGFFFVLYPDALPVMYSGQTYSMAAKIINLLGGFAFLLATANFLLRYYRNRHTEDYLFALHCLLFGFAGVLFALSSMWNAAWWFFHVVRLFAYCILLVYTFRSLEHTYRLLVSSNRRMERQVREQTQELRQFVEQSPYAVAMLDREMRYLYASRRWLADYKLRIEDARGKSHYELFPEIPEHWKEIHRRCLAGATEKNDAEAFARADGSIDWIRWEIRPWYDEDKNIGGILIFTEDISPRMRSQEELRKWKHVFENAAWGISIATPENRFIAVNKAFAVMHGTTPEEWVGRSMLDMYADESKSMLRELTERAHETGHITYESIHVRKDGSTFPVLTEVSAFKDTGGNVLFRAANFQDITDRKRAENAVKEQQHRLNSVVINSPSALSIKSVEGRYLIANPNYNRILGIPDETMIGKTDFEIFPIEIAVTLRENDLQVLATRQRLSIEEKLVTRVGASRIFMSHKFPIFNLDGNIDSVCSISLDITEQKKAQEKLRESEEHFRLLANSMPQLVWTATIDGAVDYYNDRIKEYAGARQSSDARWTWEPMLHPDDLEKTYETWREAVSKKSLYSCEHRVRMSGGNYRWHLSRGTPVLDAAGNVVRWYGTATDIHDQVEARNQLAEALKARDEFLSIASHELKTPLASLRLQAQLFQRNRARGNPAIYQPAQVNNVVDQAEKQASRLSRLVDDMLDIARIRTGRLAIQKEKLNFPELVGDVVERMRPAMTQAGTPPEYIRGESIEGLFDRFRMEQIVTNLLTNAMRYGDGRPVTVSVARLAEERVRLSVQDRGIGIPPEDQERIFHRFERAVDDNISGLGLGLFITRQIAESHGGKIRVESAPGQGSTFIVELPLHEETHREKQDNVKRAAP